MNLTEFREIAYAYAKNDMTVIPINGKIPVVKDWSNFNIETSQTSILKEITGIGLLVKPGIVVIDIDTKDKHLINKLKSYLPSTFTQINGDPQKGGKFLFWGNFKWAQRKIFDPNGSLVFEVYTDSGQIALPPSTHPKGVPYTWEYESELCLVNNYPTRLTDAMTSITLRDIDVLCKVAQGLSKESIESELPRTTKLVFPLNLDQKVEGIRHDTMMNLAFTLVNSGINEEETIKYLIEKDKDYFKGREFYKEKDCGKGEQDPHKSYAIFMKSILKSANIKGTVSLKSKLESEELEADLSNEIIEPYDMAMLPERFTKFVTTLSDSLYSPIDAPLSIVMTYLGSILGQKKHIQLKPGNDWTETPNLYTCYCSESGTRKSELGKICSHYVSELESELEEKDKKDGLKISTQKEINKAIYDELQSRLRQAIRASDEITMQKINEDLNKYKLLIEQSNLKPKQLIVNRTSLEMFIDICEANQNGVMLYSNELSQIIETMAKKGQETLRQFLLDGFDGYQRARYQTKSQGSKSIEKLTISILTYTQPDTLYKLIKGATADGFYQRFDFVFNDGSIRPIANIKPSNPQDFKSEFSIFRDAYYAEKEEITCTPSALNLFLKHEQKILDLQRETKSKIISPFIGKQSGKTARYAYIFHYMNTQRPTPITEHAMRQAIYYSERQLKHVRYLEKLYLRDARLEFIELLKQGSISGKFSARAVERYYKDTHTRSAVLTDLLKRKIIIQGDHLYYPAKTHVLL